MQQVGSCCSTHILVTHVRYDTIDTSPGMHVRNTTLMSTILVQLFSPSAIYSTMRQVYSSSAFPTYTPATRSADFHNTDYSAKTLLQWHGHTAGALLLLVFAVPEACRTTIEVHTYNASARQRTMH